MKSNSKKLLILIVIALGFVFLSNIKLDFGHGQKSNIVNPKASGGYSETFIHIDGSIANNWSWTAGNESWCYGEGTWENPYIIENVTVNCGGTGSGILIENSDTDYFIIRNCTVYNSGSGLGSAGINLDNTNNGVLTTNNCSNNNAGGIILFNDCDNNTISGNTANNNSAGIYLYEGSNITISGNTANYNIDGIYIEISNDNIISGNTANGNSQNGIYLYFCDYNNITGNTIDNNYDGIYLDVDCDNNIIWGNNATDNVNGIVLDDSNNNTLLGNSACNNNNNGIYLSNTCTNITISGNIANDNEVGMYIYNCHYNIITGNTANDNVDREGIVLDGSNDNIISGNTIDGNEVGMFIYDALNNTIISNTISSNNVSGIHIDEDSDYNEFTENFFLNNGQHAFDDGTDNKWNSTTIGNYWDNHTGPDTSPRDGIVDDPYTHIGGPAGAIDYLPIAEDGAPSITINSPASGGVFYSTAPSFNVTITDDHLDKMWYTIDGGLNKYTFTNNGTIDQSAWDALSLGSITINFYANDTFGYEASEDVIITKSIPSDGDDPTIVIVIVAVSVVGGVAVIAVAYLFLKKRKA